MDRTRKSFAVFFILIMAISSLSLLMVKPASAETNPSVPQFSLRYLNQTVEIRIINQYFTPNILNGHSMGLYYDIRWKEHNEVEWHYFYPHSYLFEATNSVNYDVTDSSVTVVSYGLNSKDGDVQLNGDFVGKQLDFEVQALIGYYTMITTQPNEKYHYPFDGEISGYSNTQTVTISATSASPSPISMLSPTPTPTVPELSSWASLLLLTSMVVAAGLLVYHKKHKHNSVKKP